MSFSGDRQRGPHLVREEHPVELGDLLTKLYLGVTHVRMLFEQSVKRPFSETSAIPGLDQRVADSILGARDTIRQTVSATGTRNRGWCGPQW